VTHVVITHAHWDHFAGTTHPTVADGYAPTFPNARHSLGAADWEDAALQAALHDPSSLESRSLGVLHDRGLLEPVAGVRAIAGGVELRSTPGETAGHQIVRVSSEGQTLYALGDLFHDAVEVERPDWMVTWADRETMLATRRALIADALAEKALLVAAHIAGVGRLERTETGVRWAAV
jgi:glyoxylase-like metal-dependent hydrolase (beta-lactamase superfamily II)